MTLPTSRKDARAKGEKFYQNDRPCKRKGHLSKKYASDGSCAECAIKRAQARYKTKKPEVSARMKAVYAANPEPAKARVAKRRAEQPEKVKAEKRAEYQKNREKYIARAKGWAERNPEKAKEAIHRWYYQNPDKAYGQVVKRRMRKAKRTPTWLTEADHTEMREIYHNARRLSEKTGVLHQVDHVIPLWGEKVSGLHVPWNLQILTAKENQSKSNNFTVQ